MLYALVMAVVDPTDLAAMLQLAAELWADAKWAPLVALGVVLITTLLTRIGGEILHPWFSTRTGKLVVAAVSAVALSVLRTLLAGGTVAAVVAEAIGALLLAIGIHSGAKNLKQGNPAPEQPKAEG